MRFLVKLIFSKINAKNAILNAIFSKNKCELSIRES